MIIPTCIDAGNKADLPGLKGSIMLSDSSTDPKMPEVKLYNAVMDKYAGKTPRRAARGSPVTSQWSASPGPWRGCRET